MIAIPEQTGEIPVATLTGRSESAVGHRLSATGLITRKMHGATMLFQQLQRGNPDLRIELVDVTGNEQSHFHVMQVRRSMSARQPLSNKGSSDAAIHIDDVAR